MFDSTSADSGSIPGTSPGKAEANGDLRDKEVASIESTSLEEYAAADVSPDTSEDTDRAENGPVEDGASENEDKLPTEPRLEAVKASEDAQNDEAEGSTEEQDKHPASIVADEAEEASENTGPDNINANGQVLLDESRGVSLNEEVEEKAENAVSETANANVELQQEERVVATPGENAVQEEESETRDGREEQEESEPGSRDEREEQEESEPETQNESAETTEAEKDKAVGDVVVPDGSAQDESEEGTTADREGVEDDVVVPAASEEGGAEDGASEEQASDDEPKKDEPMPVLAGDEKETQTTVVDTESAQTASDPVIEEEKISVVETKPLQESDVALSEQSTLLLDTLIGRPQKRLTRYWILSVALLVLLLLGILTPLIAIVSYGVNAYATYNLLRAHAYGGVDHLLTVKTIFAGAGSHPSGLLDAGKLTRARGELEAAHDDFKQVQTLIDTTSLIHTITLYLPQYRSQVTSVRAASQIGIDTTLIGEQLVATALTLAPRFKNPLLSASHAPLITANDLTLVGKTIDEILPSLSDIQVQSRAISLGALPINESQRTQIQGLFQMLPQVQALLQQGRSLLAPANWLLGVDQPRVFLVQTMDRAELRPTGGFTGQYGELSVDSGRVGPFSLRDISGVEYSDNSPTSGRLAPTAYRSWWPFENWGLRDSNLSADFPTSARIAIKQYKLEVKRNVDGVIVFTPFFIEHILQAIGPVQVPKYNETITAQNLEDRLHYYQLNNSGIRKIEVIEHVNDPAQARKLFTSNLARVLMDRVRHASPTELTSLGLQMLSDLRTRDLQVYVTNPQVESLLEQYDYAGSIDRSNTHDGLYVVQANVSASKASQYVQTKLNDTIKMDSVGGATHTLEMDLIYNQIGPVYGLDTYRDYVRIYVPQAARLLSGDGFDTGEPLCGGPLAACPDNGVYSHHQLVCPTGQYDAGASAPMIGDPYQGQYHPIDKIGPPDNTKSDESGRAMFGGYVVVPKNCSMRVTVSWYVPPLGDGGYNLLVQRQASTYPTLNLTVLPAAGSCSQADQLAFNGILTEDKAFLLASTPSPQRRAATCSLQQEAITTGQQ